MLIGFVGEEADVAVLVVREGHLVAVVGRPRHLAVVLVRSGRRTVRSRRIGHAGGVIRRALGAVLFGENAVRSVRVLETHKVVQVVGGAVVVGVAARGAGARVVGAVLERVVAVRITGTKLVRIGRHLGGIESFAKVVAVSGRGTGVAAIGVQLGHVTVGRQAAASVSVRRGVRHVFGTFFALQVVSVGLGAVSGRRRRRARIGQVVGGGGSRRRRRQRTGRNGRTGRRTGRLFTFGAARSALLLLLVLHATVLEPNFDLTFRQIEQRRHFYAPWTAQVAVEVELLLQFHQLG